MTFSLSLFAPFPLFFEGRFWGLGPNPWPEEGTGLSGSGVEEGEEVWQVVVVVLVVERWGLAREVRERRGEWR